MSEQEQGWVMVQKATSSARKPARPKFRRRAEARPDEVLDAALDLFMEKGYAATRVEDIARRAGLSKGAVYLYFPSKEAIIEALVRRALVPVAAMAEQHLSMTTGDPRQVLRMVAMLVAEKLNDPRVVAIPKIIVREVGSFPQLAEMYRRETIDRAKPVLVGLIERGIAEGVFRPVDPELTVRSVVGPLVMHLLLAEVFDIVPEGGLNAERFINHHLDMLFNGLLLEKEPDHG